MPAGRLITGKPPLNRCASGGNDNYKSKFIASVHLTGPWPERTFSATGQRWRATRPRGALRPRLSRCLYPTADGSRGFRFSYVHLRCKLVVALGLAAKRPRVDTE